MKINNECQRYNGDRGKIRKKPYPVEMKKEKRIKGKSRWVGEKL
jgi:hypothetical protein